jgi:transcriptional regulator with XRE-family HTH domain
MHLAYRKTSAFRDGVKIPIAKAQEIARRLKAVRVARRISQIDLARWAECSQPSVVKWERGRTLPNENALRRIAYALGVPVEYLLGMNGFDVDLDALTPCAGYPGIFLSVEEAALRHAQHKVNDTRQTDVKLTHPLGGRVPDAAQIALAEKRRLAKMTPEERAEAQFFQNLAAGRKLFYGDL